MPPAQSDTLPRVLVTLVLLVGLLLHSSHTESTTEDLCDLATWYTEVESDGAFVDPEPEVKAIEAEVKALLQQTGGEGANIECAVLTEWEGLIYSSDDGEWEAAGEAVRDEGDELLEEEEEKAPAPGESLSRSGSTSDERDAPTGKKDGVKGGNPEERGDQEERGAMEERGTQGERGAQGERGSQGESAATTTSSKVGDGEATGAGGEDGEGSGDDGEMGSGDGGDGSKDGEAGSEPAGSDGGGRRDHGDEDAEPLIDCPTKVDTHHWAEVASGHSHHDGTDSEKTSHKANKQPKTPGITSQTPGGGTDDAREASDARGRHVSERELLSERLLAEQLRADYSAKVRQLEVQLLRMENKLLGEKAEKHNTSSSQVRLENQMLRIENELLRINASFTILRIENAQLRAQLDTDSSRRYPALTDSNATAVATLVDKHQDRLSQLGDVTSRQADLITALDKKAEQLEQHNGELQQTLVTQADLIKDLIQRVDDLHQQHQREQTTRPRDVIEAGSDEHKQTNTPGSHNLRAPHTLGARMRESHRGLHPGPADDREVGKVGEETVEQPGLPRAQPDEDTLVPSTISRENHAQGGPSVPARTVAENVAEVAAPVVQLEAARANVLPAAAVAAPEAGGNTPTTTPGVGHSNSITTPGAKHETPLTAPGAGRGNPNTNPAAPTKTKTKKASSKRKKKALKKKGAEKEAAKNKRKVLKRAAAVVPAPKYVDDSYTGFKDCYDHFLAGRKRDTPQRIKPVGQSRDSTVFCDMRNGGWTVILRRHDGLTDFYRKWTEYEQGFGDSYSDHWAGLELLHRLTNQGHYQLRVDLTDWARRTASAVYDLVRVEGADRGYRLHIAGYSGTAGDGFAGHSGMQFSTWDKDNDLAVSDFGGSCASRFHGAWWYAKCYKSNLTGRYYRGGTTSPGQHDGVAWKPWTGSEVSLKKVEMKIRPKV